MHARNMKSNVWDISQKFAIDCGQGRSFNGRMHGRRYQIDAYSEYFLTFCNLNFACAHFTAIIFHCEIKIESFFISFWSGCGEYTRTTLISNS